MALTRNFKDTIVERVNRDAQFAQALSDEVATLFLNDKTETARLIRASILLTFTLKNVGIPDILNRERFSRLRN